MAMFVKIGPKTFPALHGNVFDMKPAVKFETVRTEFRSTAEHPLAAAAALNIGPYGIFGGHSKDIISKNFWKSIMMDGLQIGQTPVIGWQGRWKGCAAGGRRL